MRHMGFCGGHCDPQLISFFSPFSALFFFFFGLISILFMALCHSASLSPPLFPFSSSLPFLSLQPLPEA